MISIIVCIIMILTVSFLVKENCSLAEIFCLQFRFLSYHLSVRFSVSKLMDFKFSKTPY